MKKLFSKSNVLVLLLCIIMVSTFAVSFAYWKSGIDGNSDNKTLNINIGEGNAIETKVNLGAVVLDDKALIPANRVPNANQTNLITFTVKVTWTADNLSGSDPATFAAHTGQLTVRCTNITLDPLGAALDATNWNGLGGYPLFEVLPAQTYYDIVGNDQSGVDVVITVRMHEPADKAQYLQVAGKGISVTLSFVVQSQYELQNA